MQVPSDEKPKVAVSAKNAVAIIFTATVSPPFSRAGSLRK